jgi:hypothetical protein
MSVIPQRERQKTNQYFRRRLLSAFQHTNQPHQSPLNW